MATCQVSQQVHWKTKVHVHSDLSDNTSICIYLHCSQRGGNLLDQAHCMSLLVHAYQLQNSDVHTLMVALRQLNTVEEAEEDIHQVHVYDTFSRCFVVFAMHFFVYSM